VIQLVGIGDGVSLSSLDTLSAALARELRESCKVLTEPIDPAFAYDPVRNQYHATSLLRYLTTKAGDARLLGISSVDLYVPIFTFVYGEAQLAGPCALISEFRLRQTFYGLPADAALTGQRLLKEALHELGHTYGLRHCHDWSCPMASSTTIERLDQKNATYCVRCWRTIHG
jgi:archaemetzincin